MMELTKYDFAAIKNTYNLVSWRAVAFDLQEFYTIK